jgi:hypothetical protein
MPGNTLRRRRWWPSSLGGRIALVAVAVLLGWPLALTAIAIVVAVVATAVSLVMAFFPLIAVGLLGFWLVRRHPARSPHAAGWPAGAGPARQPWPPSAPPVPPAAPQRAASPDPLARLQAEQRAQVDRIHRKAAALLEGGRFPAGSRNLHLVRRTLDAYLPTTLHAYLALPPGTDDWVAAPDGRTSVQVLRDQLTLLEAKLDEVAGDLWRSDVQRLLANERFLEEHFGRRQPDELTIS